MGSGGARSGEHGSRGFAAYRAGARKGRRRPSKACAAIPALRGRADGIRASVLVLNSPGGLVVESRVGSRGEKSVGAAQRHGSRAGKKRRARARARSRTASPRIMPAPGFALRLALGEMAGALLLS